MVPKIPLGLYPCLVHTQLGEYIVLGILRCFLIFVFVFNMVPFETNQMGMFFSLDQQPPNSVTLHFTGTYVQQILVSPICHSAHEPRKLKKKLIKTE